MNVVSKKKFRRFEWIPLRLRKDKTKPQFFIAANNIWSTIINHVTPSMITGTEDIPRNK